MTVVRGIWFDASEAENLMWSINPTALRLWCCWLLFLWRNMGVLGPTHLKWTNRMGLVWNKEDHLLLLGGIQLDIIGYFPTALYRSNIARFPQSLLSTRKIGNIPLTGFELESFNLQKFLWNWFALLGTTMIFYFDCDTPNQVMIMSSHNFSCYKFVLFEWNPIKMQKL